MARAYQPLVKDKDSKIRKAIEKIRKRTRMDKSAIFEVMLNYAISKAAEIFPEINDDSK